MLQSKTRTCNCIQPPATISSRMTLFRTRVNLDGSTIKYRMTLEIQKPISALHMEHDLREKQDASWRLRCMSSV